MSCTVAEAQARCTEREFRTWIAYGQVESWGNERLENIIAEAAALICTILHRAHLQGSKTYKPSDFKPAPVKQKQTQDEMVAVAKSFFDAYQGQRDSQSGKSNDRQTVGDSQPKLRAIL
jgi:hypothetical protein